MGQYRIAIYIRLSLEDFKTDSYSIGNQRIALRNHAESLVESTDAEILEFVDNGYSGTNFERPAMQELLEMVRSYRIDCIIVKDFSRFGRNSIETGYLIEQVFPIFHTRLISIGDNFDSADYKEDTGGIEVAFKYLISECYSRDLSKKSKSAKYARMARGEYQSKVCLYGYKKGADKRLEIDETVAPNVRLIFELSLQGHSAQQIIETLYAKRIPTPGEYKSGNGNKTHDISRSHQIWQRSTVLRILADERYTGTYIIGKREVTEVGGHKTRLKEESKWFKIPKHHPAIVDTALFAEVQARLQHFRSEKTVFKEYPLRGKVFCGCCHHALIRLAKKVPVFQCKHSKIDSNFECHGLEITESELECVLFDMLAKQAQVILNLDGLTNLGKLELQIGEKATYERQMQTCQSEKRMLYEQYFRQEIDLVNYTKRKSVCDLELDHLKQALTSLAFKTATVQKNHTGQAEMRNLAEDVLQERRLTPTLTDALLDKVYVYPGNRLEITWKIKDFIR